MEVYPLVFDPIYKPKIWGGQEIFKHFHRSPVENTRIGESWELADLEEDASCVSNGPACGVSLTKLVADWGVKLMGAVSLFEGRFPLLIKYLDAQESLSVQVHPTEKVARRLGGNVRIKHEAWYVLSAQPGGVIYHGLEPGLTPESFRQAMLEGKVDGVLRKIRVKRGECYYLPSGTPHALGAGVLVAEIQTPSDITYRTYDWGRVDPSTGRPRDLHLDMAIECLEFDRPAPAPMQDQSYQASVASSRTRLATCSSFVIDKVNMTEDAREAVTMAGPLVWMILAGRGSVLSRGTEPLEFGAGDVLLLPAALADAVVAVKEDCEWLAVSVPQAR